MNVINPEESNPRVLPTLPLDPVILGEGDVFRHIMAGGGGHGDALDRDPKQVREDLLDGKINAVHARDAYGVVVFRAPDYAVDETATSHLRRGMRP